jgi:hypothetical protein
MEECVAGGAELERCELERCELERCRLDIALPVLAGERRAATLTVCSATFPYH